MMLSSSSQSTRRSKFFHLDQAPSLCESSLLCLTCDWLCLCSHKRLTQQKKLKERERKELDAVGRRHLANVRVVQRNVVYVVGIGQRFAKEEVSRLKSCCAGGD